MAPSRARVVLIALLASAAAGQVVPEPEEALVSLKAALLTALMPTFFVAAMLILGFFVRGVTPEPGWPMRAAVAASVAYICFAGLILFSTRKSRKR